MTNEKEIEVVLPLFDFHYYQSVYPDLDVRESGLVTHFCAKGWREGRNPNPFFDTVSYLKSNSDVSLKNINPYFHYIIRGKKEERPIAPSITPSVRSNLLFGYPVLDWVAAVRPYIDNIFYMSQFEDSNFDDIDPIAHFAFRGWREGFSPSAHFSVDDWVRRYPILDRLVVNPLVVFAEIEASRFSLNVLDRAAAAPDRGIPEHDENPIKVVELEFSRPFYLQQNPDVASAGVDALEHYFYTGWKEGRKPNSNFDPKYYLDTYPDVRESGLEPLWHYLVAGRREGRKCNNDTGTQAIVSVSQLGPNLNIQSDSALPNALSEPVVEHGVLDHSQPSVSDGDTHADGAAEQLRVVAREFSPIFYLESNSDIRQAGVDPLNHYFYTGWKEGRRPNKNFDPAYYLAVNKDVRDLGIEPFWHYLVAGRSEGRLGKRPGGYRREIIDKACEPAQRTEGYVIESGIEPLSMTDLAEQLTQMLVGRDGVVFSFSHDSYIGVIGGTQIFISDEQVLFNQHNFGYLHLSPSIPRLELAPDGGSIIYRLIVDGRLCGYVESAALLTWLANADRPHVDSYFVVHCALGFSVEDMCKLYTEIRPQQSFFWTHDYSSLCAGFNLLRNDVQFCGAPPAHSMACRICVYGTSRTHHLRAMERLFDHCRFVALAPSEFTLNLWRRASRLTTKDQRVHPHWALSSVDKQGKKLERADKNFVSLAFLGFPSPSKGWGMFEHIVDEFCNDIRYKFYHFAAAAANSTPGVTRILTEVTREDRFASIRLLEQNRIDFVLLLSPWPETFSFVAYEAIASGAHLLCLSDSGNVADVVRRTERGVILDGLQEVIAFFQSGEACRYVESKTENATSYTIDCIGTTANVEEVLSRGRVTYGA